MPFTSKRQARYMFATDPSVAKEMAANTGSIKSLPEAAKGRKKGKSGGGPAKSSNKAK